MNQFFMNSQKAQKLNLAYQKSQKMQNRDTGNLENQKLKYVLKHLFAQMIPSFFYQNQQGREGFFEGKIGLFEYQIKSSPVFPNSGMVGMVAIKNTQNGQQSSFVIKPEPKSDKFLLEQRSNPTKAKYVPKILTTFDASGQKWLVCQELKGFHDTEIVKNLGTRLNPEKYAQNAAKMVLDCAKVGLRFMDVNFQRGHNIFATDEDVKLVEQGNLQSETNLAENEIITERLLQELENLNLLWLSINEYGETKNSKEEWIKVYKNRTEAENQTKFVFTFLQNILSKFLIENLYIRQKKIPMASLSKKQLFYKVYDYDQSREKNLQNFEPLWQNLNSSDSPLKQRLENFLEKIKGSENLEELSKLYQTIQGQEFELYSIQNLPSVRFPLEIYDLITQNNFEEFRQKCVEKRFDTSINDTKDPAYYGYIYQQEIGEQEKNTEIIFKKNPTGWENANA